MKLRVLHSILISSGLDQSVGSSDVEGHNGAAGAGPPLMLGARFYRFVDDDVRGREGWR